MLALHYTIVILGHKAGWSNFFINFVLDFASSLKGSVNFETELIKSGLIKGKSNQLKRFRCTLQFIQRNMIRNNNFRIKF